jgi:hypothetical protein
MAVFWVLHRVVWYKFIDVSVVRAAAIIRASTAETSVNFYQTTRRNNPEDSHLQGNFPLTNGLSVRMYTRDSFYLWK